MSEQAAKYQASEKWSLARGFAYRGEIILVLAFDVAVMWPSWLNGLQVAFANQGEAKAFVDAQAVMVADVLFRSWTGVYAVVGNE